MATRACVDTAHLVVQIMPAGHSPGDVIYALIDHSDEDGGGFKVGAKGTIFGPNIADPDTKITAEFEGWGSKFEGYDKRISIGLTQISHEDPNTVGWLQRVSLLSSSCPTRLWRRRA